MYAYGNSDLRVALLALFAELVHGHGWRDTDLVKKYRLPNMTIAAISRDSIRDALVQGITANQILHFLQVQARTVHRNIYIVGSGSFTSTDAGSTDVSVFPGTTDHC